MRTRLLCMFYTDNAISGGKLVIDVSYFGWHIHSETHDLCEETSCPVSVGDFVVSHSQILPGFTPPVSQNPIWLLIKFLPWKQFVFKKFKKS